jgi:hypothetical protein
MYYVIFIIRRCIKNKNNSIKLDLLFILDLINGIEFHFLNFNRSNIESRFYYLMFMEIDQLYYFSMY